MRVRLALVAVLMGSLIGTALLAGTASCGRSSSTTTAPSIALRTPQNGGIAYIEVRGLPDPALSALGRADLSPEQWSSILRVAVAADAPPVLGKFAVAEGAVRFTPLFPFDEGRQYQVRFDPGRVPGAFADAADVVEASVGRPASTAVPSTSVARVYPGGDEVPENLLRMYIEFSAPMGRRSGVEYITLLDPAGREITGAVLPL